ncbi:MAG: hypothetical protein QUT30_18775 [Acidobacteriota bacterium]|nr:hypothetical protein [Acidobacteriota bacterium]
MKRILVTLCLYLACCVSGFAQDRGVIQCESGSNDSIPAWTAPGRAYVVEQLSCGQMVSIVGLERGFVKIQIGERFGYVDAKHVRLLQTQSEQDGRIAHLEAQVQSLQQRPSKGLALPESREDAVPFRYDVSGMFTWVRAFGSGYDADYFGWNAAFNGNVTNHFGLEVNAFGNYWNSPISIVGENFHGVAGGPRITFPSDRATPYIHFLVGFAHAKQSVLGVGFSAGNYLTLMPGFGLDVNLNRRFALRAIQADYPVLHGQNAWSYKNMRIGAGFVTRF